MMMLVTLVVVISLLSTVSCHDWGFGRCPTTPSQERFNTNRFLKTWYVLEQTDTDSECLLLNFERTDDAELSVTKIRQLPMLKRIGIDHTNRLSAALDLPYDDEARMRVKWTTNPGKADYTIVSTDYDNYALVYECQRLSRFMHRLSAAILSTTDTLPESDKQRLRNILEANGVDTSSMEVINHANCETLDKTDVNIDINRDVFKNIGTTIQNGFETAATTIADGVRTVGTTITGIVGSTSTTSGTSTTNSGTTVTTSTPRIAATTTAETTTSTPTPRNAATTTAETTTSTSSTRGSRAFGGEDDNREPIDNNPAIPDGNPDDIGGDVTTPTTTTTANINDIFNSADDQDNAIGGDNTNTIPVPDPVDDIIRTVVGGEI